MSDLKTSQFDSILLVSFGGPNSNEEVIPFLENVLRGRNVPRARLEQVAEHYYHFGGKSPINEQNLALIAELQRLLEKEGPNLPIYFGNRNWSPYFSDAFELMKRDGKTRPLAFFTSVFSSYSGCRQYRENLAASIDASGEPGLKVSKLRMPYNHPLYISAMQARVSEVLSGINDIKSERLCLVFTAHSIPVSMADGCKYQKHFAESSRLVAEGFPDIPYKLAYQSRSGAPHQPWLEPDISDVISNLKDEGYLGVVVVPIGFVSDHMEVLYDLDHEAHESAEKSGVKFYRAGTAGTHPDFIRMIRELIIERINMPENRAALGSCGASHDVCPVDCCLPGDGRPLLPTI